MTITTEKTLYDTDFALWIEETANLLRSGEFERLDLVNLLDEVESLGRQERRSLDCFLTNILEYSLKRRYVTSMSDLFHSWEVEVRHFRYHLEVILQDSPSLEGFLLEIFDECYQSALEWVKEAYPYNDFPTLSPFPKDIQALLNQDFWEKY